MIAIPQKVATLVLAKSYFVVTNPLVELKGETLETSKLSGYEKALGDVTEQYRQMYDQLQGQRTPGRSNPRAGGRGRELQVLRRKGMKARARVEVAKWMKKQGLTKLVVGDAKGDMLLMKNPQDVLKGETIDALKLKQYEAELAKAEKAYTEQKKVLDDTGSGAAKGREGQSLAKLGEAKRKAQARVQAAKQLQKAGLSKVSY
jgi:hypothetical protein